MNLPRSVPPVAVADVDLHGLRRTFLTDATGVAVMTTVAVGAAAATCGRRPAPAAARRNGRYATATGLLSVAAVGVAGLLAGARAVRAAQSRRTTARSLVIGGAVINTVGTIVVLVIFRRYRAVIGADAVMLLGGNLLSARYLHHFHRH